jgi:hypothetical protein
MGLYSRAYTFMVFDHFIIICNNSASPDNQFSRDDLQRYFSGFQYHIIFMENNFGLFDTPLRNAFDSAEDNNRS